MSITKPCGLILALAMVAGCGLPGGQTVAQQHPQREVVGTLEEGHAGNEPCQWLVEASGRRWVVFWPDGWQVLADPVRLRDPAGAIVARAGDQVRVTGPADAIGDSLCGHDVFAADKVASVGG